MPAFKDEHVLIIAPGSRTTLAQLGLPESFSPARLRLPTRMFPGSKKGEWEPVKIIEKRVKKTKPDDVKANGATAASAKDKDRDVMVVDGKETTVGDKDGDVTMVENAEKTIAKDKAGEGTVEEEDRVEYEEDPDSDEGAVYPIQQGLVKDWSCFLALLTHIRNTLSPPFHTPILLIAEPAWTAQDRETVTQFCFEKSKTPAFCMMDSALAVCYAFGAPSATVVDVGYEKCDVTAVVDFMAHEIGRGIAIPGCGGEAMTQKLMELLRSDGWTRDMCEQLKKSNICEILPKDTPLPGAADVEMSNADDLTLTGLLSGKRGSVADQGGIPRIQTQSADSDDLPGELKAVENSEGILDVASIVASGKEREYLAKKEREKAERAAKKAGAGDASAAAAKPMKLPNSRKLKNTFVYVERRKKDEEEAEGHSEEASKPVIEGEGSANINETKASTTEQSEDVVITSSDTRPTEDTEASNKQQEKASRKEEKRKSRDRQNSGTDMVQKEIEVGIERFKLADGGILDTIADTIHRTIMSVEEISKRSELWDSLIIVGNGRFKDALLTTLTSKYLISPSSATIFTSELPSTLSTPLATGANTPQPQHAPTSSTSNSVNPLLQAALTASNPHLHASLHPPSQPSPPSTTANNNNNATTHAHSSHGQTPTSIKLVKTPEYFPMWKEVGFEEAIFLGAQVAAKVVFVVDQGVSKGFMTRQEYNETGPSGIHEVAL
ncbi:MAG: Actin-like protein arp9 (SWI/SNF complex component arp9) [Peltula sp. TS41687]|nr:MAG: Actin-like protein arp9 (SWI/SNF complex component arp9) [Peltula sp. TS41687]